MKYYLWFKDCVVTIDKTHIPIVVPTDKAVSYKFGRKNKCIQNVMIVCSFKMRFMWIWPRWKGSLARHLYCNLCLQPVSTVIIVVTNRLNIIYLCWLPKQRENLAPYRSCKYHLQDIKVGVELDGRRRYLIVHVHPYETSSIYVSKFWNLVFLYWRGWSSTLYRLKSSLL